MTKQQVERILERIHELDVKIEVGLEQHKATNEHLRKLNGQVAKNTERSSQNKADVERLHESFNKVYGEFHDTKVERRKFNWFWMERAVYVIIALGLIILNLK